jgi:hypothetical protein
MSITRQKKDNNARKDLVCAKSVDAVGNPNRPYLELESYIISDSAKKARFIK